MVRYYRKIIKITAEDSPNVQLGLYQQKTGRRVTDEQLVPGVLPFGEYLKRRETWDKIKQCICLDGEFYKGAELLMYPPDWLSRAERFARKLEGYDRKAKAIGIDPAEGGARTVMTAIDEFGIVEQVGKRTRDTSEIPNEAIAFMRKHRVRPSKVAWDRGGGGQEHCDTCRSRGYNMVTVAFGEAVFPEPSRGTKSMQSRIEGREQRYVYTNRRAQMYGELRHALDPGMNPNGFAIPSYLTEYTELRRQLSLIPLKYDKEGRLRMLPKEKNSKNSNEQTLVQILGASPDEADSLVLALYIMNHEPAKTEVGAPW